MVSGWNEIEMGSLPHCFNMREQSGLALRLEIHRVLRHINHYQHVSQCDKMTQ